ncbi:hypothetical protein [Nostoc sp. CMAA1605]|uniref:hypothetical protein n=1 Tax=Nostoc sp. CMAA1605 TaxID=2055159 RepID=UPI001F2B4862|nr:hypothetical protein [Nostoc sp. CMAA1605]
MGTGDWGLGTLRQAQCIAGDWGLGTNEFKIHAYFTVSCYKIQNKMILFPAPY